MTFNLNNGYRQMWRKVFKGFDVEPALRKHNRVYDLTVVRFEGEVIKRNTHTVWVQLPGLTRVIKRHIRKHAATDTLPLEVVT